MSTKDLFLDTYQKVPVKEYTNTVSLTPLVSVCIQTYMQAPYIGKCLDGILMQKTNFDFEILLGEDASTDGTRKVCLEYAKKYPNKIRLFLHTRENNIKIFGIPTGKFNVNYNIYNARGKYLAMCEGDDFWTDENKLQKQIDFLKANQDYGLIYSDIKPVDENGNDDDENNTLLKGYKNRYKRIRNLYKSGDIFWTLLEKNLVNTLTVCVEKELILDYMNKFYDEEFSYDHRLWLHAASHKKVKFVNEQWGHYRVLNQGISNSNGFFDRRSPLVKQSALINYLNIINYDEKRIDKTIFYKVIFFILQSKHLSLKEKHPTIKLLMNHPSYFIKMLVYKIKKIFKI